MATGATDATGGPEDACTRVLPSAFVVCLHHIKEPGLTDPACIFDSYLDRV